MAKGGYALLESDGSLNLQGTLGLAANNITLTGSIGSTGARSTKGWFTDLQVTNSIAGSITGSSASVTGATFTTALTVNTGTVTLTGNVANTSVLTIGAGAVSVSGPNTGDQTTISGNAGTATALQTARNINGVSFNGTADITVTAAAGTLSGATLNSGVTASSLTSVGTLTGGATGGGFTIALGSSTITGTLAVANGGINIASYAVGDIIYASGTTTLSKLADVVAGSYMRSGGVTTAPVWSTATLPNTATQGDLMAATGANTYGAITAVAAGRIFISQGSSTLPVFSTALTYASNELMNTVSANSAVSITALNANASGSAQTVLKADNGTYTNSVTILGTGFTTSGLNVANLAKLATSSTVGLLFQSTAASTKFWWTIGGFAAANEEMRLTTVGLSIGTQADPTATLNLQAGTTTVAPLGLAAGTNKTTAAAGEVEYNGTNFFATRTGTTRETLLTGLESSLNVLGLTAITQLVNQIKINVLGNDYYVPCGAANTPLT